MTPENLYTKDDFGNSQGKEPVFQTKNLSDGGLCIFSGTTHLLFINFPCGHYCSIKTSEMSLIFRVYFHIFPDKDRDLCLHQDETLSNPLNPIKVLLKGLEHLSPKGKIIHPQSFQNHHMKYLRDSKRDQLAHPSSIRLLPGCLPCHQYLWHPL